MNNDMVYENHDFHFSNWNRQLNDFARPFERVCFKLSSGCGAIPLGIFLRHEYDDLDLDYHNIGGPTNVEGRNADVEESEEEADGVDGQLSVGQRVGCGNSPSSLPTSATTPDLASNKTLTHTSALDILHQTCIRLTGTSAALSFEIVEDKPQKFIGILTIQSLNGTKRTYKTKPEFANGSEAKGEAARIAIEMGALDFIRTGNPETHKKKNAELVARAKIETEKLEASKPADPAIQQIEDCCKEVDIKSDWINYRHWKNTSDHGCALRVGPTPNHRRVYSTDASFPRKEDARAYCARIAIDDGVLDYIKCLQPQTNELSSSSETPTIPLSLQEHFDALPKPFPINVGDKPASELQPINMVNSVLQHSKIPQLKAVYYWTTADVRGGLVGCVMRIERPNALAKTYIADPRFAKRADAKSAVCLLAISQGLEDYTKELQAAYEKKLPPEHRLLAESKIIPMLTSRSQKRRFANKPWFEYVASEEGHGCTLTLDLSSDSTQPDHRTFTVEKEYRTKADARLAAAIAAVKAGAMELFQFGDTRPPEDRRSCWQILTDPDLDEQERNRLFESQFDLEDQRGKKRKLKKGPEKDPGTECAVNVGPSDSEEEQGEIKEPNVSKRPVHVGQPHNQFPSRPRRQAKRQRPGPMPAPQYPYPPPISSPNYHPPLPGQYSRSSALPPKQHYSSPSDPYPHPHSRHHRPLSQHIYDDRYTAPFSGSQEGHYHHTSSRDEYSSFGQPQH
ncbi:hypothetical protein FA15DRAFT_324707 [Coprinopsis marcescibilis]|uniref:Uncharacterized protein n=1 Tax=Coprinopsis marcescibilis TaxID=230819 RepID=A0A5C3KZ21_COPMA|nr:hypothetical protein FA15DRAFT_324707 [Coprinopsis marcescibilis]